MENIVVSRRSCWYEDEKIQYLFPDHWKVQVFAHANVAALNEKDLYDKIENPIQGPSISAQIRRGMKVLIICDDIYRPTRTDLILPVVLKILVAGGIKRQDVSVLISSGSHPPMTDLEKTLKFGKRLVGEIRIVDHDYRKATSYAGHTGLGTPVFLNRNLIDADFIIGIGGIYPHEPAGFGGGAKLILGVCGEKTIKYFHYRRNGVDVGGSVTNEFRNDVLDASQLAGLDFLINNLVNKDREIIGIFAGDVQAAFLAGVEEARKIFRVPNPQHFTLDVVVADAYPFDSTFAFTRKGWWPIECRRKPCFGLILSAIRGGIGSHPIFPVVPSRFQRFIDLHSEFQVSSMKEFLSHSLLSRARRLCGRLLERAKYRHSTQDRPDLEASAGSPPPVTLLHDPRAPLADQITPSYCKFMTRLDLYNNQLRKWTEDKPLNVGFYQTSSLTFPE